MGIAGCGMSKTRFLIEGVWRGYRSSQDRVVHREVTRNASRALWCENSYCIGFTDGTTLELRVREVEKGERIKDLKNSYGSLIDSCIRFQVTSVAALLEAEKAVAP